MTDETTGRRVGYVDPQVAGKIVNTLNRKETVELEKLYQAVGGKTKKSEKTLAQLIDRGYVITTPDWQYRLGKNIGDTIMIGGEKVKIDE